MSADNYFVVRPVDGRWVCSMGFASDDTPACKLPVHPHDPRFATEHEAIGAALDEYSEYGVSSAPYCAALVGHAEGCDEADARIDEPVEAIRLAWAEDDLTGPDAADPDAHLWNPARAIAVLLDEIDRLRGHAPATPAEPHHGAPRRGRWGR